MAVVVILWSLTWTTLRLGFVPGQMKQSFWKLLSYGWILENLGEISFKSLHFQLDLFYVIQLFVCWLDMLWKKYWSGIGRKKYSGDQNYDVYSLCSQAKK